MCRARFEFSPQQVLLAWSLYGLAPSKKGSLLFVVYQVIALLHSLLLGLEFQARNLTYGVTWQQVFSFSLLKQQHMTKTLKNQLKVSSSAYTTMQSSVFKRVGGLCKSWNIQFVAIITIVTRKRLQTFKRENGLNKIFNFVLHLLETNSLELRLWLDDDDCTRSFGRKSYFTAMPCQARQHQR